MGCFIGAVRVNLINLKRRIYYLHNISAKSKSSFSVSWQPVSLSPDNQQERGAHARFISLHSFSSYKSSLYFAFFPLIFLIWILFPHILSSLLLLPICCFLIFVQRGPGHILISQLHISALPAAPSLVVPPWLAACLNIQHMQKWNKKNLHAHMCTPASMSSRHVSVYICVVLPSSVLLCWSVLCCLLLVDKETELKNVT